MEAVGSLLVEMKLSSEKDGTCAAAAAKYLMAWGLQS